MADYSLGRDFSGFADISPALNQVTGRKALIEAIGRRLITPRGSLFYDPDYGYDVRMLMSAPLVAPGETVSTIRAEIEKDSRVAHADVTISATEDALLIDIELEDALGPFEFVLEVTNLTVQLMRGT